MTNINLWQRILLKGLLVRTFWHLDNRWDDLWAECLQLSRQEYIDNLDGYLRIDNFDKFRQYFFGNTVQSVSVHLICLDKLSTIVWTICHDLSKDCY